MKNKLYRVYLVALGVFVLMGAYVFTTSKRNIEIVPGLKWEYYTDNYSRLVWDKFGAVATGRFDIEICDYGLNIISSIEKDSCYLDLREHRIQKINEVGTNLSSMVGAVFLTDAQTAMGVYTDVGRISFENALRDLRVRLENAKLRSAQ